MRTLKAVGTAVATLAILLTAACSLVGPGGLEWTLTPATGPMPAGGVAVGEFTDPDSGVTYKLYDMNGDGKPDFAKAPNDRLYHVHPPGQGATFAGPTAGLAVLDGQQGARVHGHPPETPDEIVLYINEPETPMPMVFTQTAADSLATSGLGGLSPGEQSHLGSGFHVNDLEVIDLRAGEFELDITVEWSGYVPMPNMMEHGELQYEFFGLSDQGGLAEYLSLRVVGPDAAVARWMAELGIEDLVLVGLQVDGVSYNVRFTSDGDTAEFWVDGKLIKSIMLR